MTASPQRQARKTTRDELNHVPLLREPALFTKTQNPVCPSEHVSQCRNTGGRGGGEEKRETENKIPLKLFLKVPIYT